MSCSLQMFLLINGKLVLPVTVSCGQSILIHRKWQPVNNAFKAALFDILFSLCLGFWMKGILHCFFFFCCRIVRSLPLNYVSMTLPDHLYWTFLASRCSPYSKRSYNFYGQNISVSFLLKLSNSQYNFMKKTKTFQTDLIPA